MNHGMVDGGTPYYFEDLQLGMESTMEKTVSEADLVSYAEVSGDTNPVHLDAAYAANTIFKERIAHGLLTAGYISAVFGTQMPGPGSIYVSQTLNFRAPVKIGDAVTTSVRVIECIEGKRRVRFDCLCKVGDKTVLEGEATLLVPARPS